MGLGIGVGLGVGVGLAREIGRDILPVDSSKAGDSG